MEFFVHQNGETAGPFSRETVERMNLDPGTLVWHEGMPTWLPAAEVEELADLYRPGPGSVRPQECAPPQPAYSPARQGYGTPPPCTHPSPGERDPFREPPHGTPIYDHPRCMTRAIIATVLASLGLLSGISAPFVLLLAVPALILGILAVTNTNSSDNAFANGNGPLGHSLYSRAKNYANISLLLFAVSVILFILTIFFFTALAISLRSI